MRVNKKEKNRKKAKINKLLIVLIVIIIAIVVVNVILNLFLINTNYKISSEKITKEFDGYKITQLSDIHSIRSENMSNIIVTKIKKIKPDIIVITGDLIDTPYYSKMNNQIIANNEDVIPDEMTVKFINKIIEIAPVYYIYGNHEMMLLDNPDSNVFKVALEDLGVNIINNKTTTIKIGTSQINILGIQDPATLYKDERFAYIDGTKEKIKAMLDYVVIDIDTNNFTILLSHRPEYFEIYENYEIDLALTGHVHGGQVRFPIIGGLYAPNQGWFPKYDSGLYKSDSFSMIVNRGIGNFVIPLRVFNSPEIVTITLKNK